MAPWTVKYDGPCSKCGVTLRAGEPAVWVRGANRMECIECPTQPGWVSEPPPPPALDLGRAGGSARERYERSMERRDAELRDRWGGKLGGFISRFAAEPQSIRAWGLGARGEELLGEALSAVPGLIVLNDRRVRGTRGNIDHIVIAPAGVFVVDAKYLTGIIEVRDYGGWFRTDLRLTVGRRNKSHLARNMDWQVDAVLEALTAAELQVPCRVVPILCFVDGSWPVFRAPDLFEGVRLESERSIVRVLSDPIVHSPDEIDHLAQILVHAFPPKTR